LSHYLTGAKYLHDATTHILAIQSLEQEHHISTSGLPVQDMRKKFKTLCAAVATTDPVSFERAVKVLRGKA
jgi:hypothetical protein